MIRVGLLEFNTFPMALRYNRTLCIVLSGFLFSLPAESVEPRLNDIVPNGGQRGQEIEVTFQGERLQDAEEVICYEPGIQTLKLNLVTNKLVKAQLKLAADAGLGEYHLRIRTASGLSEIRTFFVGPFPTIEETEPNDEPAKAQKVSLNATVAGIIKKEDVDCFAVDLKQGQRFSAEVQGMRLGRGDFDPRLTVLAPDGQVIADADDTWLGKQDPYVSFQVPKDGAYLVRLREATYQGNDNCKYRLHLGSFPRPGTVFPAGGQAGSTNSFVFLGPAGLLFTNLVTLPPEPREQFGIFPQQDGHSAPTPNWVRVSEFLNILGSATNHARAQATVVTSSPPFALNGILEKPGQEDWFRFPATKGAPVNLNVYARRLHSPVDSIIEVYSSGGQALGANDDSAGADSVLRFTPPETTNYLVRVRDTLGQGGPDFVYRIEATPDQPSLTVKIPEVARNDTQSRQFVAVPRGNRVATLISGRRSNLTGELAFSITNLPTGVVMSTNRMAANVDAMPVVFEATAEAPVGGKLVDLLGFGTNGTNQAVGRFRQDIDLVSGPNNTTYYATSADHFCVAVTKEAPFKLRLTQPKVPLVQGGSMALEVITERNPGFDQPIELQMVWNPPGVSSQPEVTLAKAATNAVYSLNATPAAEVRSWKIAVLGHATVEGGQLFVSSQLADLEIAAPYISGKIETVWTNPGKAGKLTVSLQHAKPFEGAAKIRLAGLPDKVTATEKEIKTNDTEVVFDLTVETNCPVGSFKNLFCTADIKDKDTIIPHAIAHGGILRIVPPKKAEPTLAAGGKK